MAHSTSCHVPSCMDYQCNKSWTTKTPGPLHALPVPDTCRDSVAINFISPLPPDGDYDCLLLMMDHLISDLCIVPTRMDIMTEDLGTLFFDHWYCENGLPLNIVSDCDKLFMSKFLSVLTRLTGVKLKMSSVYHAKMDGASECSNKTIN